MTIHESIRSYFAPVSRPGLILGALALMCVCAMAAISLVVVTNAHLMFGYVTYALLFCMLASIGFVIDSVRSYQSWTEKVVHMVISLLAYVIIALIGIGIAVLYQFIFCDAITLF